MHTISTSKAKLQGDCNHLELLLCMQHTTFPTFSFKDWGKAIQNSPFILI